MSDILATDTMISANSPDGFYSFFESLINTADKVYILKGGPGTGKSTFLKGIAAAAREKGYHTELIHCSSDPHSLDGVRIEELNTVFADGTPPHTLEPPFPGASGSIINLGDFWDTVKLTANRDEIILLNRKISSMFDRTYRFIGAAAKLHSDLFYTVLECTDVEKINNYAEKIVHKLLKKKNTPAKLTKRFLGGYSPEGFIFYPETILNNCDDITIISDEYGLSTLVLEKIRDLALKYGYDVTAFYSPLDPNKSIEHLIIPEIKAGFLTSNMYHYYKTKPYSRIRIERFIDKDKLKNRKARISFIKKAKYEILCEAINCLKTSKSLHDELEVYYKSSMDFNGVKQLQEKIIKKVLG